MSDKKLLRQFLDSFQRLDDCLVFDKEVTPEMIVKRDVEDWKSWDELQKWQPISVKTSMDELDALYSRIGGQFPILYERLILSHRWLEVDLGIARLLANPPGPELTGLAKMVFSDPILSNVLVPAGFIPFARSTINDDPICFDLNAISPQSDCPIIQFEHEAILCHSKIGKSWQRWESFREFMTEVIFHEPD